jgi:hypothetical protein
VLHFFAHDCTFLPRFTCNFHNYRESFAKSGKKLSLHHGNKAGCSISVENQIRIHNKNTACFLIMAK